MLAAQIAQEPAAGLYNGLIVAAFLGSTINGTIPLALGQLTGTKRAAAVRGLFLGFLVLPVGCLLTGALCGITLNTAYAVVAAYSVGDFLAFTLQFSPAHALPMMAGRLLSGLLAVVLCLKTTTKTT